ncbi:MAG TPA: hypothetical protein VM406_12820 [Noviherbaspirillum sp.]|nr:hypothetical protein [Noviherbaspirillum sp.]
MIDSIACVSATPCATKVSISRYARQALLLPGISIPFKDMVVRKRVGHLVEINILMTVARKLQALLPDSVVRMGR